MNNSLRDTATKRITKSKADKYEDLLDYLEIIEINKFKFLTSMHRRAKYKTLLFSLRVLFGKNQSDSLFEQVCDSIRLKPSLKFRGMKGVPSTNPLSLDKIRTFEEYASDIAQVIEGKQYTNRMFIWELASQDSAHSDQKIHKDFVFGYSMEIFGATPNERMVLNISQVVYKYGWQVIKFVLKNQTVFK